jgi:hypothetical protein
MLHTAVTDEVLQAAKDIREKLSEEIGRLLQIWFCSPSPKHNFSSSLPDGFMLVAQLLFASLIRRN